MTSGIENINPPSPDPLLAQARVVTRRLAEAGLGERIFPNRPELRPQICRCRDDDCDHDHVSTLWVQANQTHILIVVSNGQDGGQEIIHFVPGQSFKGGEPLTAQQEELILRLADEYRSAAR